jgi:hypothetical protein
MPALRSEEVEAIDVDTIYQGHGKALREGFLQRQQAVVTEVGLPSRPTQALQVRGHNSTFSGVSRRK